MIIVCDCGELVMHSRPSCASNVMCCIDTSHPANQVHGKVILDIVCPRCKLSIFYVVHGLPEHDQVPAVEPSPVGMRANHKRKPPPEGDRVVSGESSRSEESGSEVEDLDDDDSGGGLH